MAASVHAPAAPATTPNRDPSSTAATTTTTNKKRLSRPSLSRRLTDSKTVSKSKRRSADLHKNAPSAAAAAADEDDDVMSGGFSQFCATCETQIVVPSVSILYCSESCRRKDCGMSPPTSPAKNPIIAATHDADVDIIPPLSPTVRKQPNCFDNMSPASVGAGHDAFDASNSQVRPSYDRKDSEASRYPSQFHGERARTTRPRSSRQSTVPSLSHSPASASSSVPYTMVKDMARPLPSSRALVSKSVDLVTPAAARPADSLETLTARAASLQMGAHRSFDDEVDVDFDDDVLYDEAPSSYYEKRAYDERRVSTAHSSLKQLLESGRERG